MQHAWVLAMLIDIAITDANKQSAGSIGEDLVDVVVGIGLVDREQQA